jgi:hypothetical protein
LQTCGSYTGCAKPSWQCCIDSSNPDAWQWSGDSSSTGCPN